MNSSDIIIQSNEHGNIASSFEYVQGFNFPKNFRILDVGCQYGSLIFNLNRAGYAEVYGIDILTELINKGKQSYSGIADRIQQYGGDAIPHPNNSFDVVMMFDVIEHLPNPALFIENEVMRVLKPGGIFVFQTPNKIINIPWEIIHQKSFTKWKIEHCSLQTLHSLKRILAEAGFSSIKIEKGNILTEHNKNKVLKKMSWPGIFLLYAFQFSPLIIFPNLWGSAKKESK